jgi:ATP-dependent Lhr-like helicase
MRPAAKRKVAAASGRWSLFRGLETGEGGDVDFVAKRLLDRTGVVFRTTLARERILVPWRDLLRAYRTMELRGDVRGGRFVAGFSGEQYALPEAVSLLRAVRRRGSLGPLTVSAADPLNLEGVLTPGDRVAPATRRRVTVA